MSNGPICPVILAGGTGSRLWPVSRSARPKQFARLSGSETLLADTVRRLEDAGCGAPIFLSGEAYRWAIQAEAEALGLVGHRIVLEPEPRGTAAAIFAAAEIVCRDAPETLMLVAPSDHAVADPLAFADAVSRGADVARHAEIVVFGVTPDRPETGFGYIELSEPLTTRAAVPYAGFVEKPDAAAAEAMLSSGRYVWNAGVFLATAETFRAAFVAQAPEVAEAVGAAVTEAELDLGFLRLGASYRAAPDIAFDRAILERQNGWVVPLSAGWSDIGTWRGVWSTLPRDETGSASMGAAWGEGCENTLLVSTEPDIRLVGLGLTNVAAVATRDAVLVVDMEHGQSVRAAVERLSAEGAPQAETFTRDDRPWGHFETLARGPRFQVKSIVVKPGAALSLQAHAHRAEHWVVVEGTATVTIGGTTSLVTENQSVYIPTGTRHRLANEGRQPLRLIEVQTGTYLGEDDIVRFDDVYQRT